MTEIALRPDTTPVNPVPQAVAPSALVEWAHAAVAAHELATSLSGTQFCPDAFRGKPGEATAAILAGAEVGMSPLAALNAFDVIQGRPAPKAITLRALAQSHGHDIWLETATPQKVVMKGQRRGSTRIQTSEWTIQRANALGLTNKPNWKNQPQAMLTARATSEIAKLVAADVILGIPYSAEELADLEPEPTRSVSREPATKRTVARKAKAETPPEADEPSLDEEPAVSDPPPVAAEAEPEESTDAITDAQKRKIMARFNELEITDRTNRLDLTRALLDAPTITSANELTKEQASTLIDLLEDEGVNDASDLYAAAGLLEP